MPLWRRADWQFVLNEHGKPALAGAAHALDFNLSHSGDWLACAVTAGTPVGVDIEYCHPKRTTMKLARRFFRQEEVAALQVCSEAQQRDRFYDFWTLKEAAVKARGEALVPGLEARGFELTFRVRSGASERQHSGDHSGCGGYGTLLPFGSAGSLPCGSLLAAVTPLLPKLRVFELREGQEAIERIVPLRASSSRPIDRAAGPDAANFLLDCSASAQPLASTHDMIIEQYFSEPNGRICFTREQGSNFAKQMANDFNPLHDADAKRFCIPGDLLFAIMLAKYGISQHMEFVFSGMVVAGVELVLPEPAARIAYQRYAGTGVSARKARGRHHAVTLP